MLNCPNCKKSYSPAAFLDHVDAYSTDLDVVVFSCPHCAEEIEARISSGRIEIGYVYSAGAPHFAAMETYEVDGLECESSDKLTIEYDGKRRTLANKP